MRAAGLEWLYRLAREPARWRRMLALPAFAALAVVSGGGRAWRGRPRLLQCATQNAAALERPLMSEI